MSSKIAFLGGDRACSKGSVTLPGRKKGTEPTDKEISEVFDKLMAKTNAMRASVRGEVPISPLPGVDPGDESSSTSKPTGPR